jgi:hypothetical protein
VGQRIAHDFSDDPNFWHEVEELYAVVSRQIRDRQDLSLLPQQTVRKARNVAHMDTGADNATTFAHRRGHPRADQRIDDRTIEFLGRHLVGSTGPTCAELAGEALPRVVA